MKTLKKRGFHEQSDTGVILQTARGKQHRLRVDKDKDMGEYQ